ADSKTPGALRHRASCLVMLRSLAEGEGVELAALRDLVEAGGLRHRRCTDRAELVVHVETSGNGDADPAAETCEDRDVLLALDLVGDRVADDAGAQLLLPEHLARVAVDSAEVAALGAVEHQ